MDEKDGIAIAAALQIAKLATVHVQNLRLLIVVAIAETAFVEINCAFIMRADGANPGIPLNFTLRYLVNFQTCYATVFILHRICQHANLFGEHKIFRRVTQVYFDIH